MTPHNQTDCLVTVDDAAELGAKYGAHQVIIFTYDGETTGVTTWGHSDESSEVAADGANMMKRSWGWPGNKVAISARVQALHSRIEQLESALVDAHLTARRIAHEALSATIKPE